MEWRQRLGCPGCGCRSLIRISNEAAAAAAGAAEPLTPFHIAVQVRDIAEARAFYKDILGCPEGRSDIDWVDFNLYGHQFVCHLNPRLGAQGSLAIHFNLVDGHGVPVPHCGVVLRPAAMVLTR